MNLLRSSTLLILGLVILVGERIYFVHKSDVSLRTGESADLSAQNSTFNDYNQYLQGTRATKSNTINTNAYSHEPENEKNVLHTANSRLKLSSNVGATSNNDPWDRFSDELPKVFMLKNAAKSGVDYSNKDLSYLKHLADQGDTLGKFLYAYELRKSLDANATPDPARITEIRLLYIQTAAQGLHAAAHELSQMYASPKLHDLVEALSWALIADAMRDRGEKSVSKICSAKTSPCSGTFLAQATTRARNYLSSYAFKLETAQKK